MLHKSIYSLEVYDTCYHSSQIYSRHIFFFSSFEAVGAYLAVVFQISDVFPTLKD